MKLEREMETGTRFSSRWVQNEFRTRARGDRRANRTLFRKGSAGSAGQRRRAGRVGVHGEGLAQAGDQVVQGEIVLIRTEKINLLSKDGDEIGPEDVHFKRTSEPDGTCRLTLPAARITDAGVFRCQATNPSGTARTEAPLRVLLADESPMPTEVAPEFLQDLKPVQAKEGDEAVFECKVAGTPAPDIKWYKDGVPLGPEDGVKIESLPDGTHRLIIPKTRLDDQGNYRCEATNPAGSMSSKAPLSVIREQKCSNIGNNK